MCVDCGQRTFEVGDHPSLKVEAALVRIIPSAENQLHEGDLSLIHPHLLDDYSLDIQACCSTGNDDRLERFSFDQAGEVNFDGCLNEKTIF